ncbi:MAG: BCCT family transporter, partial [Clostridia bacterium]
ILGVVGVPIIFTCLWFGIFGCIGIEYKDLLYATMSNDISTSLFIFLQQIVGPTGYVFLSGLVLIIICLFFITSPDSGSYVVAALVSSKDDVTTNEKILWSCIQCCVAMALFYLGGLALIQSVSVIMGILVMLLIGLGSCFFIYHLFKINQSK